MDSLSVDLDKPAAETVQVDVARILCIVIISPSISHITRLHSADASATAVPLPCQRSMWRRYRTTCF